MYDITENSHDALETTVIYQKKCLHYYNVC